MNDSDSEDDYGGLQRQAFSVDLPHDFDPLTVPQNGEEYLHHVMYEASNCEQSTYAKIDEKKIKDTMMPHTMLHPQEDLCKTVSISNLPSEEWQQRKLTDFNKVRKFVAIKRNGAVKLYNSSVKELLQRLPNGSHLISSSQTKILSLLQELLNITVLDYVKHLDSDNSCYVQHLWIYGLLACLEIPLCPDTCHLIRQFARNCIRKRSQLEENCTKPELTYYNLIICIVGQYFNQKDLADIKTAQLLL